MFSVARLTSINRAALALSLWLIAIGLMVSETLWDWIEPGMLGRWAILAALAATCSTVSAMINHARRVVLECMSWEHKNLLAVKAPVLGESISLVPPLQRR